MGSRRSPVRCLARADAANVRPLRRWQRWSLLATAAAVLAIAADGATVVVQHEQVQDAEQQASASPPCSPHRTLAWSVPTFAAADTRLPHGRPAATPQSSSSTTCRRSPPTTGPTSCGSCIPMAPPYHRAQLIPPARTSAGAAPGRAPKHDRHRTHRRANRRVEDTDQ